MKKIALIMGSTSDLPIVEKAVKVLEDYALPFEVHVLSAHRCPQEASQFASTARESGFSVLVAFAGMAAHLAGTLAANTTLPVIGVPCRSSGTDGSDALWSTVMMPPGIPVATVAIDGGKNAALLAIQMMAVEDVSLAEKLASERAANHEKLLASNREVFAKYSK